MKMTVLYHSKSGNTKTMAEIIVEGMSSVDGVEAKSYSIDDIDENWIKESKCVVVGSPIYMADISGELKSWLVGPSMKYNLAGKIGGAFATADYIHGGGDLGIQNILHHMMVLGMLTYSSGAMQGVPVIHLGPVALSKQLNENKETFTIYGQRMAQKTLEIFA